MTYRIRVTLLGTTGYLAAKQSEPAVVTTFDLTDYADLAARFKTRKAAEDEISRRALGGLAQVEEVL